MKKEIDINNIHEVLTINVHDNIFQELTYDKKQNKVSIKLNNIYDNHYDSIYIDYYGVTRLSIDDSVQYYDNSGFNPITIDHLNCQIQDSTSKQVTCYIYFLIGSIITIEFSKMEYIVIP